MNDLDLVKLEMLEQRGKPADQLVMFHDMHVPITFGQIADFGVGGAVGINDSFDPFNEAVLFFEARKALPKLLKLLHEKDEEVEEAKNDAKDARDALYDKEGEAEDADEKCNDLARELEMLKEQVANATDLKTLQAEVAK